MAGYSSTPLPRKLGIKPDALVALLASPPGFEKTLGDLPDGVEVRTQARGRFDVILFFATRERELARRFPVMARALVPDGGLWVAWPKKKSCVATDLTFDPVQEVGLDAGLVDNKVCAIDDTWSALRFVVRKHDRPGRGSAMCGRFIQTASPTMLAEHFDVDEVLLDGPPVPSWNVAPRADVLTIDDKEHVRRMRRMRWGLVPAWATDPGVGDRMINARAETVLEKPAFRRSLERRRCIVPADGFYEWERVGSRKQPMYIHARSGAPLAFAGLWAVWRGSETPDAPWMRSCTIVTTDANATVAPVHDRMPVMLAPDAWDRWLDREITDGDAVADLLRPAPDDLLELWPVSPRVNSARHDDARLIEREDPLTLFG